VPPELRRQGLGTLAASIAAHEALASGLTLQWRTALDNRGSIALARKLGFVDGGIHTSVLLR
jgi:RimJ/RimL family protein N-acetyltransferase